MKYISILAMLVAIASSSHDEPTFELLATFEGLKDLGVGIESCEYDEVNDIWLFFNVITGHPYTLPGTYPLLPLEDGDFDLNLTASPSPGVAGFAGIQFSAGDPNYAYIANNDAAALGGDGVSRISQYDIDADTLSVLIELPNVAATGDFADGLCYDAENDALYVTSPGEDFTVAARPYPLIDNANFLYRVENIRGGNPTATAVNLSTITDRNGTALVDRRLNPNGCTVANGKVWMIDSVQGGLGVYDIATGDLTLRADLLAETGDGIIPIENYLVVTLFTGTVVYYDMDEYPDGAFETGLTGITGFADIDFDPSTGVICIPQLTVYGSVVDFVRITLPDHSEGDDAHMLHCLSHVFCAIFVFVYAM